MKNKVLGVLFILLFSSGCVSDRKGEDEKKMVGDIFTEEMIVSVVSLLKDSDHDSVKSRRIRVGKEVSVNMSLSEIFDIILYDKQHSELEFITVGFNVDVSSGGWKLVLTSARFDYVFSGIGESVEPEGGEMFEAKRKKDMPWIKD